MIKMSEKARKAAKDLATAYGAYCTAKEAHDAEQTATKANSLVVWSMILRDRQKAIGIEMLDDEHLESVTEYARKSRDALERKAA